MSNLMSHLIPRSNPLRRPPPPAALGDPSPPRPFTLLRLLAVIALTGALSALASPTVFPGLP